MVPYLVSVEYANADGELIVPASVARQYPDDVEDLSNLCGTLGKLQHVLLSGVDLSFALRTKSEASHRVAGRGSIQTPLMILSVVVEVV